MRQTGLRGDYGLAAKFVNGRVFALVLSDPRAASSRRKGAPAAESRRMRFVVPGAIAGALLIAGAASAGNPGSFPGTKDANDRAEWRTALEWSKGCEREWKGSRASYAGVGVFPTGTPRWLVAVTCAPGAYQGTQLLYLVDRGLHRIGPIPLHIYRDPGNGKPRPTRIAQVLGTLDFNLGTSRLVVLDKFRGAGDCGILSVFRLQKQRFYPLAVRAKLKCDGKGPFNAFSWPLLPLPHGP